MLFERSYRDLDLSYFFLKDRDRVIKDFGEYYAEFFLIQKSLFDFYYETKNLLWIVWYYAFIILFNMYEIPIKQNPDNPDNPLLDVVFLYANSFLYVQLWLINNTKEYVLNQIELTKQYVLNQISTTKTNILNKISNEKQNDSNNTYCEVIDNCDKGSCGCSLHHYLTAWDNAYNYSDSQMTTLYNNVETKFNELKQNVEDKFNWLIENTKELFKLRLYWTFILVCVFTKLPYLAIRIKEIPKRNKELSKINMALLIIIANRHKSKEEIKERIKQKMGVSDNAVNIYLTRLKEYGYIWYDKNSDKIELRELAFKKADYLLKKYNLMLWDFR